MVNDNTSTHLISNEDLGPNEENCRVYLCLDDAPSPTTAESCLISWPDCLIPLSGFGDGEATGVVGGVAGESLPTSLPILILGLLGESLSII